MDSDSIGDRLKKIQISKEESMKEVPKILSPEIHDVFHVFASMLDLKSFMKLAMTSKDMNKRCMNDKNIRINVDVNKLTAKIYSDSTKFDFSFANVSSGKNNSYVAALQKLPCKIKLGTLDFQHLDRVLVPIVPNVRKYMEKLGVDKIQEITIFESEWEALLALVKDFDVNLARIDGPIGIDILRSILQHNVEKLVYNHSVPADFLLELDFPIRAIYFCEMNNISQEELMDILAKIQSGSIMHLAVNADAINWNDFEKLPFDQQGQLPDDRPLLLARTPISADLHEYWFLHWHGGISKFIRIDRSNHRYLHIFKCEPCELPYILRKDEDILKDLAEKRPRVSCSEQQFQTFITSLAMFDSSHEGPLPENRPLYYKNDENNLWMLDMDGNLMECTWKDGSATWDAFNPRESEKIKNPVFAKFVFWKLLNQVNQNENYELRCNGLEMFSSWFEEFEKLDFFYLGPLPSARPLVFECSPHLYRILYLDGRLLECNFFSDDYSDDDHFVRIKMCNYLQRPQILFTENNLMEMLEDDYKMLQDRFRLVMGMIEIQGGDTHNFPDDMLVEPVMPLREHLVMEKSASGFWYMKDGVDVRRVEWKSGQASSGFGNDLRRAPLAFTKQIFKHFAQHPEKSKYPLTLDLEQFHRCLEEFTVLSFDYSGPLSSDSPLAFVKKEIRHTCRRSVTCQCSEDYIHVLFLWDGKRVTECSWRSNRWDNVVFRTIVDSIGVPPASEEFLKTLLKAEYDKSCRYRWFGRL